MAGEVSNRSAQGQAFCNMGFAQSQLGEYKKAGESFMHAIQAAKDSSDKKGLWQAYEGLAAVRFLRQDYDRAVEYYKLALSVLSTTGETDLEHNNRIVSKLANALECQVFFSNKLNGKLPPLRIDSMKSNHTVEKRNSKSKRVGKTRSRQEHHQLIARGIDGDQTPSEAEECTDGGSSQECSSDEKSMQEEAVRERTHKQRVITTEAEVHHQRMPSQGARKKSSTDSSQEERAVKERERRRKRPQQSRKTKSSSPRGTLNSTRAENHYEQLDEVDSKRASAASPAKSDYSDDMPRAHREAYLASVQASTASRPTPNRTEVRDEENVQSKTCVIQ